MKTTLLAVALAMMGNAIYDTRDLETITDVDAAMEKVNALEEVAAYVGLPAGANIGAAAWSYMFSKCGDGAPHKCVSGDALSFRWWFHTHDLETRDLSAAAKAGWRGVILYAPDIWEPNNSALGLVTKYTLPTDKQDGSITTIEMRGNYAVSGGCWFEEVTRVFTWRDDGGNQCAVLLKQEDGAMIAVPDGDLFFLNVTDLPGGDYLP